MFVENYDTKILKVSLTFLNDQGANGERTSHIVLKAWKFLRPRRKVLIGAPAQFICMTLQWHHSGIKYSYNDVIMTLYYEIFAGAPTQTVVLGFRNLHTKYHAFISMCEILLICNFLKPDFSFPPHCLPIKSLRAPSFNPAII